MERARDAAAHAALVTGAVVTIAWIGFLGWAGWHFLIG